MAYFKAKILDSNVWWNQSYNDCYHFESKQKRIDFFNNKFNNIYNRTLSSNDTFNFDFGNGIKTTITYSDTTKNLMQLVNANYMIVIYSSDGVSQIPFFYFIDAVSIKNSTDVEYSLTLDVMTTYIPGVDYSLTDFMVVRKHFDRFTSDSTKTAAKFDFTKDFNKTAEAIEETFNSKFYKDLKTITYGCYNRALTQEEKAKMDILGKQKWMYVYMATEPLKTDSSFATKVIEWNFSSQYKTNFGKKYYPYKILCMPVDMLQITVEDENDATNFETIMSTDIRYFTQSANILANVICNIPPIVNDLNKWTDVTSVSCKVKGTFYHPSSGSDYFALSSGGQVIDQVADPNTQNEIHFKCFDVTSLWESATNGRGQTDYSYDNELLNGPINLTTTSIYDQETKYYSRGSFNQYELKNYQNNSFVFDLSYVETSNLNFKRVSSLATLNSNTFETITNAPVNFSNDYTGIIGYHSLSLTCLSDAWTQYQATNKNFMQTGLLIPIASNAINSVTSYVSKGTFQALASKQATYGNIMHSIESVRNPDIDVKAGGKTLLYGYTYQQSTASRMAMDASGFDPFKSPAKTMLGATAVGAAVNFAVDTASTIASFNANINNIQNSPDTVKLQGSSMLDFFVKDHGLCSYIRHSELRDADKKIVCQYFHDCGYAFNQIQTNFNDIFVRESFNYLETKGVISRLSSNNFNDLVKSVIASILDKGVRFWETTKGTFDLVVPNLEKRLS